MRLKSWLLSLALHAAILCVAILISLTGEHLRVDLDKPVYNVRLVNLPKSLGRTSRPRRDPATAPIKTEVKEPVKEFSKPQVEAKAEPKPVSATKEPEKSKPAPSTKKPEPEAKSVPTAEQVLAEALKDVRSQTPAKPTAKERRTQEQILAEALAEVLRDSGGSSPTAEAKQLAGFSQDEILAGYTHLVGSEIRQNWRFAPIKNFQNLEAVVEVRVRRDGTIYAPRMIKASGRADYDASVMRAVESTPRVTPAPDYLQRIDRFQITFRPETG